MGRDISLAPAESSHRCDPRPVVVPTAACHTGWKHLLTAALPGPSYHGIRIWCVSSSGPMRRSGQSMRRTRTARFMPSTSIFPCSIVAHGMNEYRYS